MAKIDASPRKSPGLWIAGLALVIACVVAIRIFTSVPQLGGDEEVFKTVDALFTAVISQDRLALDRCKQQLAAFQQEGVIAGNVVAKLDSIILQAEQGGWEVAAKRLYSVMLAQRGG